MVLTQIQLPIYIIIIGLVLGWISTSGTKSQWIRIIDMLIIGPLMIYIGYTGYNRTEYPGTNKEFILNLECFIYLILIFFGSTTITYNLKNYIKFN